MCFLPIIYFLCANWPQFEAVGGQKMKHNKVANICNMLAKSIELTDICYLWSYTAYHFWGPTDPYLDTLKLHLPLYGFAVFFGGGN